MKHTLILTLGLATTSLFGLTVAPQVSLIDAGLTRFDYIHPMAGKLDGVITPSNGVAYGLVASHSFGKYSLSAEASYLDIGLESVTVGGNPKNWGDSAQGYYLGTKASRKLIGGLSGFVSLGYQDLLGGAVTYGYGVEYRKGIASLSLERRHIGDSTYDGLEMRSEPSNIVALKIGGRF